MLRREWVNLKMRSNFFRLQICWKSRLAEHFGKINNERKGTVAALVKEAKKHLEAREKINSVIVVGNPEWRPYHPRPCSQLSRRRIYATGVCVGEEIMCSRVRVVHTMDTICSI